ncbi:MAG: hypothetical protein GXX79_00875 [Actinomycetales bacterium]|nr:hypothetical protein [Actinomycetales bacterium]
MRRRIGELWIAFAVIHFVGVTIGGWSTVQDVFADGPINCIHGDVERDAFFGWFFMGVPILTTGVVTRWAQRRTGTLPESMGWITVVAFGIGALVAPLSGAWLGIALGIGTIAVSRHQGRGPQLPGDPSDGFVSYERGEPRHETTHR